jgi:hypothetical protein
MSASGVVSPVFGDVPEDFSFVPFDAGTTEAVASDAFEADVLLVEVTALSSTVISTTANGDKLSATN